MIQIHAGLVLLSNTKDDQDEKPRPKTKQSSTTTPEPIEREEITISADLMGPFPKSINGNRYCLSLHHSKGPNKGTAKAYFLPSKKHVRKYVKRYNAYIERRFKPEDLPTQFWTDGGGEFLNAEVDDFCGESGLRHKHSCRHSPEQNTYAERLEGVLLTMAESMSLHAQSRVTESRGQAHVV